MSRELKRRISLATNPDNAIVDAMLEEPSVLNAKLGTTDSPIVLVSQ